MQFDFQVAPVGATMEMVTAAEAKAAVTTAALSVSGSHALDFADRLREAADLLHAQVERTPIE